MDKLCCDICGGILTMQPGGKTVICDSCGMQYGVERLREKVQEIKGTVSVEGTVRTQDADFVIRGGVLERYNGNDTHVIIPDSVVKIGERAFENCPGIRAVVFPCNTIEIGKSAFCGCQFLEKIKFSDVLKVIGRYAFCNCSVLKKVALPETVKYIGWSAFSGCTSLKTINIPDQLEGESPRETVAWNNRLRGTFENCPALREVIISEEQKEKLFIDRYKDYVTLRAEIFEESDTDGDDNTIYSDKHCGPWYLNFKHKLQAENLKRIQEERRAENKCPYCGGSFTGFFTKKCAKCGKPKDY